jgi:hypothetical protein
MAKKKAKPKKTAPTGKRKLASKTAVRPAISKRRASRWARQAIRKARRKSSDFPEILFEGDRPGVRGTGPGERFALGATPPKEQFTPEGELPEAYGTKQILVAPRDPHWLYVHWDLTREQLREYNAHSKDKHLVLRVTKPESGNEPAGEVHVHPESRHWFVHVAEAGAKYAIELGYYGKTNGWTCVSTSAPTQVPPDVISPETAAQFATIPTEVALSRLMDIVKTGAGNNPSLAHAIEEIRLAGHPELPPVTNGSATTSWTPEQERALAQIINMKQLGRVSVGSLDITEMVRGELQHEYSSIVSALAGPAGFSSLSSPHGGALAGPGGFWFNVNAELIVYGATEPNATVTIGGNPVKLRPDGSFSFRFALPDGQYDLPVTAVSGDGTEARHADLRFSRGTNYVGDVGQHPQDPALKPPTPENIS